MKWLRRFFSKLLLLLLGHAPSRPEDIPKKLNPEALASAMQEARFLHSRFAVDARELSPEEIPGLPRMVDTKE